MDPVPMVRPIEDDRQFFDEGWWQSVLEDEDLALSAESERVSKNMGCQGGNNLDWTRAQKMLDDDEVVTLEVHGYNRGGLLVRGQAIQGFVPVSHLVDMPESVNEDERSQLMISYVGRELSLKVIECEPTQDRIVFSERAALAGAGSRKSLFERLKPGEIVKGKVTNVTEFGVFVDLGGVEGLIHVSELSWGRVQHPSEVLSIGDDINTLVLQVNEETSRVALSYKRLYSNPWERMESDYHKGDITQATVTCIMRYGVFARLQEGVEGLIHISSLNPVLSQKELKRKFFPGQKIRVQIIHIDTDRRRLGLGLIGLMNE